MQKFQNYIAKFNVMSKFYNTIRDDPVQKTSHQSQYVHLAPLQTQDLKYTRNERITHSSNWK